MFFRTLQLFAGVLLLAQCAAAEVVRVDVIRRDDYGTHERIIGRVHFAVDPARPANQRIADLQLAPRNERGLVEFSSDVLFFRPKDPARARGTVFLEVVNRGRDQSLVIMSDASQSDLAPESWNLGDRFLLEQGFTVAFLGWQFDVPRANGLTFQAPVAAVDGIVRGTYVEASADRRFNGFRLPYCVMREREAQARLTFRTRIDATPVELPRDAWQFVNDGCAVRVAGGLNAGVYDAIYQAQGSPIAGLGLAAIRDFASYLRHGAAGAALRDTPQGLERIVGYGYSQSARLLRDFVRDGFNADEDGRIVFDGMMVSAAGAGGGSFNHRFAMPGVAGNSVLSLLRPVDIPPFDDEGLLARARSAGVVPKIFYTFSSTEYWARAGSLTHTTEDGLRDVPLASTSRLYFIAGTPHASGPLPPTRGGQFRQFMNFGEQRWVSRALLLNLDAWVRGQSDPPPSVYPSVASGELVAFGDVRFPRIPAFPFASYMPQVWRMDHGPRFSTEQVITQEPPVLGPPYRILVPQVDMDGNEVSGIRIPEVAVPLGTHTGWNIALPELSALGYLGGLVGAFEPFARTREERIQRADPRLSIGERYRDRDDFLDRVRRACETLVKQRFMLAADVTDALERARVTWDALIGRP